MAKQLTKICAKCKKQKSKRFFTKNKQQKDGLSCYCKNCLKLINAAYREKNKEKIKAKQHIHSLTFKLKKFNLSVDDYIDLLIAQKGRCAICGISDEQYNRKVFDLDHNHQTGKARGLLCRKCNHLVGLSRENFLIINKLKQYLLKYKMGG